eukprot:TRINITY_DN4089_c0_g1_i2.p1 TRINITY_DN4089_c0_g1~~TRINITY_DN4089_c0_g1_i2.p1  ORF type:complete len:414 (+),score=128.51 TRINITY_DN4089_c0_g1_i2:220-1461(+)
MSTIKGTFSDDLWDKFDVVCKRISIGKNFTGASRQFLKKRAEIEREYARNLIRLCKDKTFDGENEMGSIKACWNSMREETESIAQRHETLAAELISIQDIMSTYLVEAKKTRKALIANGDKITKELRASEAKEAAAHQNYEKLRKRQDELEEETNKVNGTTKEAKARKAQEQATKKSETGDVEYKEAVASLVASQRKFYHDEMPRVLDDLQRFEEDRADKMKEWFLRVVSTQEAIPPAVATSSQNMRSITEAIDRPSDITNFIRENTTGTPKPEEAKYVPYNEGPATGAATVRRDNSRMTIAPMTSSPVTTSSNGRASLAFTSTSQSSFGSPSGPIVQPSAPAASPAVKQEKQLVRALYNYDATEDTELSFKANDMITVLQKDDSGQNATVNTFPGLVHTARHTMGVGCKRSR